MKAKIPRILYLCGDNHVLALGTYESGVDGSGRKGEMRELISFPMYVVWAVSRSVS